MGRINVENVDNGTLASICGECWQFGHILRSGMTEVKQTVSSVLLNCQEEEGAASHLTQGI